MNFSLKNNEPNKHPRKKDCSTHTPIAPYLVRPNVTEDTHARVVLFSVCFLVVVCLTASKTVSAQIHHTIDLNTIAFIESSNDKDKISYKGAVYGRGLHQISEICLDDFNNYHPIDYTTDDLFNPSVNTIIADWYFHTRIPQMLRCYDIDVSIENILASYNWGIGNVRKWVKCGADYNDLPDETKKYIKKYRAARYLPTRRKS